MASPDYNSSSLSPDPRISATECWRHLVGWRPQVMGTQRCECVVLERNTCDTMCRTGLRVAVNMAESTRFSLRKRGSGSLMYRTRC
jgi:hypothetical protein